jgi:hypothetical protein
MAASVSVTPISTNLRRRSYTPTVMNGRKVYESSPPEMNLHRIQFWNLNLPKNENEWTN